MSTKPPNPDGRDKRLSTEEAAELASQVAELAKAGLPLASGLRALADELSGSRLASVLGDVARRLDLGESLSEAIEAQGPRLPARVRGLIEAGARSGRLGETLEEFVDLHRGQIELRRRVWTMLAYPITLLAIAALLFVFTQMYLVSEFAKLYGDFQIELPLMTQLSMQLSANMSWLMLGFVVFLLGIVALVWLIPGSAWIARLMHAVPLLGPLWRASRLWQFSRLMALLIDQEVPLPEAVRLAGENLGDADLIAGARRLADACQSGRSLSDGLNETGQFPVSLVPLVAWGERNSAMSEAFRAAAEMFEGSVETRHVLTGTIMLPAIFLLILAFVAFTVIALFMPLIALVQNIT